MQNSYKLITVICILISNLQLAQGATNSVQVPIKTEVKISTCQLEVDASIDFSFVRIEDIVSSRATPKEANLNLRCDAHVDNVRLMFVPGSNRTSSDKRVMHSGTTGLGYRLQWSRSGGGYSDIGFNTQYKWSDSDAYQNLLSGKLKLKPVSFPGENLKKEGRVSSIINIEVTYD
ncbi:type 1 fimbrial protein [Salmonella enterica subsp. diarizonae]|nr:type 1 fimbrial protein [Salmonella enterica subsp. diarizonae]EDV3465788.1 type 1 fimbrial protein [Salmonella enterica subsp. diarizonae]